MSAPSVENPYAGQGAVVLDIGGDIGALVVTMPAELDGLEVEIVPTGSSRPAHSHSHSHSGSHSHSDSHEHPDSHSHSHEQVGGGGHGGQQEPDHKGAAGAASDHVHAAAAPPHVAVVARPTPAGVLVHSLVFGELLAGGYDLYLRPAGPVQLSVAVRGGEVTEATWPWPAEHASAQTSG